MNTLLGIDIGGTKIAVGLCDMNGGLIRKTVFPTPRCVKASFFLDDCCEKITEFLGDDKPAGCGIGIPGATDRIHGMVIDAPNIPNLTGLMVTDEFSSRLGIPCFLDNDANLAGLAEFDALENKRISNMVFVTVSTGIGGAIILGGDLFYGDHGLSGELGHSLITPGEGQFCNCSNCGCAEGYCGGAHISEWVETYSTRFPNSQLTRVLNEKGEVNGRDLTTAAAAGDGLANALVDRTAKIVAMLCYNVYQVLDISTFVLGGGLITGSDLIFPKVNKFFRSFQQRFPDVASMQVATTGSDAGILGAAGLARRRLNPTRLSPGGKI